MSCNLVFVLKHSTNNAVFSLTEMIKGSTWQQQLCMLYFYRPSKSIWHSWPPNSIKKNLSTMESEVLQIIGSNPIYQIVNNLFQSMVSTPQNKLWIMESLRDRYWDHFYFLSILTTWYTRIPYWQIWGNR